MIRGNPQSIFWIQELTLDQLPYWPEPIKYLIYFITALLTMSIFYKTMIENQWDSLVSNQAEETVLKKKFEFKQAQSTQLPAYRQQLAELRKVLSTLNQKLPKQSEMPELLASIYKSGQSLGHPFHLFEPQQEILQDFYVELPFHIVVIGRYEQLGHFLSQLTHLKHMVTLHDFEIRPALNLAHPEPQDNLLSLTITVKAYQYRDDSKEKSN